MDNLFTNKIYLLYVIIGIIILFIVVKIIKFFTKRIKVIIYNNKYFNPKEISLDMEWVKNEFKDYSVSLIENDYNSKNKAIYTKEGIYRLDFIKNINLVFENLIKICCVGNNLSFSLIEYANRQYRKPLKRKNFKNLIDEYLEHRKKIINDTFNSFIEQLDEIRVEQFFELKQTQMGDIVGVYIIYNKTKNMYYVGQAKRLFFRVNQHFTGHGNGDVYADYKYGDEFLIRFVKLNDSGYRDIDRLEKDLIAKFNANVNGYNKTIGNQ